MSVGRSNAGYHRRAMRCRPVVAIALMLSACGSMRGGDPQFVVGPEDVQPGRPEGVTLTIAGGHGYDKVWGAALAAMSRGMTVIESHKPSGVIKSRVGAAPSGKIVGMFITPTTPRAIEYRIETSSVRPLGMSGISGRGWEPSVIEEFKSALGAR